VSPSHQVRRWRSCYRWATLTLLAHAFLVVAAVTEHARQQTPFGLVPLRLEDGFQARSVQHERAPPATPVRRVSRCAATWAAPRVTGNSTIAQALDRPSAAGTPAARSRRHAHSENGAATTGAVTTPGA
jgi:hypothetical protein